MDPLNIGTAARPAYLTVFTPIPPFPPSHPAGRMQVFSAIYLLLANLAALCIGRVVDDRRI